MYDLNFEVSEASMSALDRIKSRETKDITESVAMAEKKSTISRERDMLEEFSIEALGSKLKADKYIYDVVFGNVQESEDINALVETMIGRMTKVYEAINVAPVMYMVSESEIVNNNEFENSEKAKEIVDSYMISNLFKLSKEDREAKYKVQVTTEAQTFVEQYKVDTDKAVDFAYKSAVVSDLLEDVHFPKFTKLYLEECMSSETYAEFFETDVLEEAYMDYQQTLKEISQLIATTI